MMLHIYQKTPLMGFHDERGTTFSIDGASLYTPLCDARTAWYEFWRYARQYKAGTGTLADMAR